MLKNSFCMNALVTGRKSVLGLRMLQICNKLYFVLCVYNHSYHAHFQGRAEASNRKCTRGIVTGIDNFIS